MEEARQRGASVIAQLYDLPILSTCRYACNRISEAYKMLRLSFEVNGTSILALLSLTKRLADAEELPHLLHLTPLSHREQYPFKYVPLLQLKRLLVSLRTNMLLFIESMDTRSTTRCSSILTFSWPAYAGSSSRSFWLCSSIHSRVDAFWDILDNHIP